MHTQGQKDIFMYSNREFWLLKVLEKVGSIEPQPTVSIRRLKEYIRELENSGGAHIYGFNSDAHAKDFFLGDLEWLNAVGYLKLQDIGGFHYAAVSELGSGRVKSFKLSQKLLDVIESYSETYSTLRKPSDKPSDDEDYHDDDTVPGSFAAEVE